MLMCIRQDVKAVARGQAEASKRRRLALIGVYRNSTNGTSYLRSSPFQANQVNCMIDDVTANQVERQRAPLQARSRQRCELSFAQRFCNQISVKGASLSGALKTLIESIGSVKHD